MKTFLNKIIIFFRRLYKVLFKRTTFSHQQKKLISTIIQKFQQVNYEEKVGGEESMAYYTRGLMAQLLESKTFNYVFVSYLKSFVYPSILANIQQAEAIQKNMLKYILNEIKYTAFGKKYGVGFLDQESYADFIQKVPIFTYDEFKPWIEQAKLEKDVIRPGKITRFSASAGTTSRKKHIPVTNETLESAAKAGLDMLATYVMKHPETQMFSSYYRPLVGTIQEQFPDGSIVSDVSALLMLDRSTILQRKYKYELEVLLEPNRYKKRDLFIKYLHAKEKTTIFGVTSRIDEMLHYLEKKDHRKFQIFIKNLELVVRGGVSAKPYIKYFNELGIHHIGAYNASEGYIGYQDILHYANDEAQAPYQLLVNHGIFYEFIPFTAENFENGILKQGAKSKPLREITQQDIDSGTKFALVITTNSGLFRYLLGDVISFVDKEYRFHIVGRTRECINLKGEELMEDHVNSVLNEINQKHHTDFRNYTIGPNATHEPTCHEWILEGDLPANVDADTLIKEIDAGLQKNNADYEAKRKDDILLQMPIIHVVSEGTFHDRLKRQNKLGGQSKVSKLSNDRTTVDALLAFTALKKPSGVAEGS